MQICIVISLARRNTFCTIRYRVYDCIYEVEDAERFVREAKKKKSGDVAEYCTNVALL